MKGKIFKIKNAEDELVLPITTTEAVYSEDGKTLNDELDNINSSLDTKANKSEVDNNINELDVKITENKSLTDSEIARLKEIANTWETFKNTGGVISNFLNVDSDYQELKIQNSNNTLMIKIDDTRGGSVGYFNNSGVEKSSIAFNNNNEIDLKTQGINLTSPIYIKESLSRNEPNTSEYSRIVRAATDIVKGSFKIQLGADGGSFEVVNSEWDKCLFSVNEEEGVKISGDVYVGNHSSDTNGFTKLTNGLILQWGTFASTESTTDVTEHRISFPISFSEKTIKVITSIAHTGSPHVQGCSSNGYDRHGFTIYKYRTNGGACTVNWIAIGR